MTTETEVRRRFRPWRIAAVLLLGVLAVLVALGATGYSLPIPAFIVERLEERVNRALAGRAEFDIARADIVIGARLRPQVRFGDLTLLSPRGQRLALVSDMRISFDPAALLRGQLSVARLKARGVRIAIRREASGKLDVAPAARNFSGTTRSPAEVLDSIDAAFGLPELSGMAQAQVEGLAILFDDRRSGQIWTVSDGLLSLRQTPDALTSTASLSFAGQSVEPAPDARPAPGAESRTAAAPASLSLEISTDKHSSAAHMKATLNNMSTRAVAAEVPALAWLSAVDAPIFGTFSSGLSADGGLGPMEAELTVGRGELRPLPDTRPLPFERANVHLTYAPKTARIDLSRLSIESQSLRVDAVGQAWLKGPPNGMPHSVVVQVQLRDFRADTHGIFEGPVAIDRGALDAKLDLDPFRLTIGQLMLLDQGRRITTKGTVEPRPRGWRVGLDTTVSEISSARLIALWPVAAVPRTRAWLAENVTQAELFDVRSAFRLSPGEAPRLSLAYRFRGAKVRYMRTLPPIIDGAGYASIEDNSYTMVAETGTVIPPEGGPVGIAGSVLTVPDIRKLPAHVEITLLAKSSVTGALSLLNQKPFQFMSKAGQPVNLADGTADVVAKLSFPVARVIPQKDISYDVTGTLNNVSTDKVVPGHLIAGDGVTVRATPDGLTISGNATFDGVPVNGQWHQSFHPEGVGRSRVEGTASITPETLSRLHIVLPDGAVKGRGTGHFSIDLQRGKAPALQFESALQGLTLAIPEVGWKKAAAADARLSLEGTLGSPVNIPRLSFRGAGLSAEGSVKLKADGSLDRVEWKGVKLADWFTGDVTLTGRGKGRSIAVAIKGRSADIRRATFGSSSQSGGEAPPLTVTMDRVRLSDDISLTGFSGNFLTTGGVNGPFRAHVNGKAPITGQIVTAGGQGPSFQVQAKDAGAVLDAAGIYESGRGGDMNMVLVPAGPPSTYNGTIGVGNIRVVDAPELAGLLNAISVVGLINELQGAGIVFSDVSGHFLLSPKGVEIRDGSAVGASLGVSAEGVFRSADRTIDFRGVISPIYLLNGIGQIVSRHREGLFGFNYRLAGPTSDPSVSVNPLSLLTPGMFRDLFRAEPPKLGD